MQQFLIGLTGLLWLAVTPSSSNYTLKNYDFGTGGGSSSNSTNMVNSLLNGLSGDQTSSATYKINPGLIPTQNANVPAAPVFTNPSLEYNRLKLVLDEGGNHSETLYAIAVSDDNFATTQYVQPDNTIGASYGIGNYQTYDDWGASDGIWIVGLTPDTNYQVKACALNGDFSQSAFSPVANAATVMPQISFSVKTTTSAVPPFNVSFSGITPGSVSVAADDLVINLSSNARFGGYVYIKDSNLGLKSASYLIDTITGNLAAATKGYGAQVVGANQSSGGPMVAVTPFDGTGDSVGAMSTALQPILSSSNPIVDGQGTIRLKAKTDIIVPSDDSYSDTITLIASMVF